MKNIFNPIFLNFIVVSFLISPNSKSQTLPSPKSVLWEISGKELKSPSYLFGTFHLLNGNYLNKIEKWKQKFKSSEALMVEMVMDSSKLMQMVSKMVSPDTTLDCLLSKSEYERAKNYFKEVSGLDLSLYNSLKPISLSALLTTYTWAKLKPEDYLTSDLPMDLFLVENGKDMVKEIIPLESMEEQLSILYDHMTLKRQKELLMDLVSNPDKTKEGILKMDECYRKEDLECLKNLVYNQESYTVEELNNILKDRNREWMKKIIPAIHAKSTFIAVGAGHLPGGEGLIQLFQNEGYTVSPVIF